MAEPTMIAARSSLRATLINLSGPLLSAAILLIATPAYLSVIGIERFGVLALIWSAVGYFGFLDLGLSRAAANFSARETNPSRLSAIFWTALSFNLSVGVVAALAVTLFGPGIAGLISNVALRDEFQAGLPWLALSIPLVSCSGAMIGMLEGRGRFLSSNVNLITGSALFQLAPLLAALLISPSLGVIIPAAVLGRALAVVVAGVVTTISLGLRPIAIDIAMLRRMLSFGGWVTVSSLVSPLLTTLDQFVIAAVRGVASVPYYSVPNALVQRVAILPGAVFRAIYPRLAVASEQEARSLLMQSSRNLSVAMTVVATVGIMLVGPVLGIWLGPEFAGRSEAAARTLLVGIWFNGLAYLPFCFLDAREKPHVPAILHVVELLPYLVVLWMCLSWGGVLGAAIAASIRMAVDFALLTWRAGGAGGVWRGVMPGLTIVGIVFAISWLPVPPLVVGLELALALGGCLVWAMRMTGGMDSVRRMLTR